MKRALRGIEALAIARGNYIVLRSLSRLAFFLVFLEKMWEKRRLTKKTSQESPIPAGSALTFGNNKGSYDGGEAHVDDDHDWMKFFYHEACYRLKNGWYLVNRFGRGLDYWLMFWRASRLAAQFSTPRQFQQALRTLGSQYYIALHPFYSWLLQTDLAFLYFVKAIEYEIFQCEPL